jgi:hypothetical protein
MSTIFTLTEEHIKLLSRANVSWDSCEFGAPAIDPKRPYGNSDVIDDIAEILCIERETCPHCGSGEPFDEVDKQRLESLHRETETALQIILSTKSFIPGKYIDMDLNNNWKLLEKQTPNNKKSK